MTEIYFKDLTPCSCSEELCGRLVLLHPVVSLESLSHWGWQSERKAECEAGKEQGQTRTRGDRLKFALALTTKLHSPSDRKKNLTFFTSELCVPESQDSEKLKEVWWGLEGVGCLLPHTSKVCQEMRLWAVLMPSELEGCGFTSIYHILWKYFPSLKPTCNPTRKGILGNIAPAKLDWRSI